MMMSTSRCRCKDTPKDQSRSSGSRLSLAQMSLVGCVAAINNSQKTDNMSEEVCRDIPCGQPTQPSQDEEPDDNYLLAGGDFIGRVKNWIGTASDIYPVQLVAVFKAGATVSLNFLQKEPKKFKEMALKHKATVEELKVKMLLDHVLLQQ